MGSFRQRTTRRVAAVALIGGLVGSGAEVVVAGSTTQAGATTPSPCPAPVVSGATATVTCAYTGADQGWTVPAGVTEATFAVYGAQGGGAVAGQGGLGGEARATFSVTPGSALTVAVGGAGGAPGQENDGVFGGGGAAVAAGGGGGASTVSNGAADLIVAGGGGGEGFYNPDMYIMWMPGGYGGGSSGTSGTGSLGGAPGTQSSGYQMGQGGPGAGNGAGYNPPNGGGGGGGYWGGDGGGAYSGGGGGSGYVNPSATNRSMETGVQTGNGEVVITYMVPGVVPVPTVSEVSPNTGPTTGGTAITITGTSFVAGAMVVIGQGNGAGPGAIAATNVTVVSSTEITAVTGGGAIAGTFNVLVTTPSGTSAGNSGAAFTYMTPLGAPTVSKVTPNTGLTTGGTAITITGTGFVTGAKVVIGQGSGAGTGAIAANNVTVVSPTEITAVTGGGAIAGIFSVFVTTSSGTSPGNSGADFAYTPPPVVPTVSEVNPNSGPTTGGTAITITGTGFVSGAKVVIGQGNGAGAGAIAATSVTVVSPTEITAVTGGGAIAGTFNAFVTTSIGTSAGNSGADFTYSE
jgi:Glycine rich protein/IPT/TIG domain